MVQQEQQYHKLHQKQIQAQQDSAWMHSVPEWHDAELVGQNKPWTVPSQLLTAEEEVGFRSVTTKRSGVDMGLASQGKPGLRPCSL